MLAKIYHYYSQQLNAIVPIFRQVEWVLLVGIGLISLISGRETLSLPHFLIFAAWVGLSFIFPRDRPLWQRYVYISIAVLLSLVSRAIGWGFDLLLYLVIIKSCFLLNRKDVVWVALIAWLGWLIPLTWLMPQYVTAVKQQIAKGIDYQQILVNRTLLEIISHSITVFFVMLVGLLVIKEYKSQQKIIALNQEVEALAAMLERNRIARDLHDTLGHSLTALGIQIEVAQQTCQTQPMQTTQRLDTAKQLTDQCLQEIREVVRTLRDSKFDLNQGLTTLLQSFQQTTDIVTDVDLDLPNIPLQSSYQVYCIIQEGITNIQKHAAASQVSLSSQRSPTHLRLTLWDNGHGFDIQQSTQGFGLRGMQERSQLIGGELKIQSKPGRGTAITIMVPNSIQSL
jgi:signal transduction histidine kinase